VIVSLLVTALAEAGQCRAIWAALLTAHNRLKMKNDIQSPAR